MSTDSTSPSSAPPHIYVLTMTMDGPPYPKSLTLGYYSDETAAKSEYARQRSAYAQGRFSSSEPWRDSCLIALPGLQALNETIVGHWHGPTQPVLPTRPSIPPVCFKLEKVEKGPNFDKPPSLLGMLSYGDKKRKHDSP